MLDSVKSVASLPLSRKSFATTYAETKATPSFVSHFKDNLVLPETWTQCTSRLMQKVNAVQWPLASCKAGRSLGRVALTSAYFNVKRAHNAQQPKATFDTTVDLAKVVWQGWLLTLPRSKLLCMPLAI